MELTQARLKEVLHYDPETGVFTWKAKKRLKGYLVGGVAGGVSHKGYRRIRVDGELYQAHRLVFLYMDGFFPELTVDHKWRNKDDNRYCSLREASYQCQSRNCGMLRNNTSGIKGVYWSKHRSKWVALIAVNNKQKNLGRFDTLIDAAYVRFAAEQCLGFQDCDTNSSAKQFIDKMEILSYWR